LTVGSRAPDVRGLDQVLARVAAWIWFPSRDAYCRSRQATLFWQVWNKAVADHVGDDLVSAAGSSLLDLAAHSDIVVVAAKLSSDARETDLGLVLRAVQPTAYFVTIARAAIVDYRSVLCSTPPHRWDRWSDRRRIGVAQSARADQRRNAMKLRLSLALVVAVVVACLIPGPAAADPPTGEEFSPVGDRFLCGETLVTAQSGTVLEREHLHELGARLSQIIVMETPNDVILTNEEGNGRGS
jgi:hypothetical protein